MSDEKNHPYLSNWHVSAWFQENFRKNQNRLVIVCSKNMRFKCQLSLHNNNLKKWITTYKGHTRQVMILKYYNYNLLEFCPNSMEFSASVAISADCVAK